MRRVKLFRKGRFVGIVDKNFHRQDEIIKKEKQVNQFWEELKLPTLTIN